jgi:hypothetical protein
MAPAGTNEELTMSGTEGKYRDTWARLNQTDPGPLSDEIARQPGAWEYNSVLGHFRATRNAKVINLRTLTSDEQAYLAGEGIVAAYLLKNLHKTLADRRFDARQFQIDAVRRKIVRAICPFTGTLLESSHSLPANLNAVAYRFHSKEIFYVITAGIGCGWTKSGIYFPRRELLITAGYNWGVDAMDVAELKARVVCNATACHRYFSDKDRAGRKTVVCLGFYHFAHHLWNELTGLHRLYRHKLISAVDGFLVLRQPLGDISEIFPEITPARIERKQDAHELFEHVVTNNCFAVRIGDDFLRADVARRVYRTALAHVSPAVLGRVKEAKRQRSPLLWLGVRVGIRSWIDQIDGLANLIVSLHEEYPRLGVVIDGFSVPADRWDGSGEGHADLQEYGRIIADESGVAEAVIDKVRQRLPKPPPIFNIVGTSIHEAIVWANTIDAYVSPYGSMQHKVAWFAAKPGVIHCNHQVLDNPPKYIWSATQKIAKPRYCSRAAVKPVRNMPNDVYRQLSDLKDSGDGVLAAVQRMQGDPEFENYQVDWRQLRHDVAKVIETPAIAIQLDRAVLSARAKRTVKRVLQGLTSRLDRSRL